MHNIDMMNFSGTKMIKRFKSLPVKSRNLLGLGAILGLVVALPLFIWAIVTQNFNPNKQAAGTNYPPPPAGECQTCGGISGISCASGLICPIGTGPGADQSGICVKPNGTSHCGTTPSPSPAPIPPGSYCSGGNGWVVRKKI